MMESAKPSQSDSRGVPRGDCLIQDCQCDEYDGGDKIIGTLILKFENFEEMIQVMDNMENYIKINLYN